MLSFRQEEQENEHRNLEARKVEPIFAAWNAEAEARSSKCGSRSLQLRLRIGAFTFGIAGPNPPARKAGAEPCSPECLSRTL